MGTMIGHSILMDRHGFPYFAEYCYYYMAGCMDKALTCITTDDVSDSVKALISEVYISLDSVCACVLFDSCAFFYLGKSGLERAYY